MKNTQKTYSKILVISTLALMGTASVAYGYPAGQQGPTYVTGGIGDEERMEMERVRSDYNVHVMSSARDGSFAGDTSMIFYNKAGEAVLTTNDAGPLLYTNLPAGKYVVTAESEGEQQKKIVNISQNKATNLHFVWK